MVLCLDLASVYSQKKLSLLKNELRFCHLGPYKHLSVSKPSSNLPYAWDNLVFETFFLVRKQIDALLEWQQVKELSLLLNDVFQNAEHTETSVCSFSRSTDAENFTDAQCVAICKVLHTYGFDAQTLRALYRIDMFRCLFAPSKESNDSVVASK